MTVVLVAAVALLASGLIAQGLRLTRLGGRLAEAESAVDKAEFEVARLTQHAEDLLVPLTWTYDAVTGSAPGSIAVHPDRLRHYLVACYIEVQRALLKDDVEMTELLGAARTQPQPRRLPSRPQVPPFLATPEDVAGVSSASVQYERASGLPQHDFDVVTTRVQGAEAPPEAYRYFVRPMDAGWVEADKETYERAGADPAVADRWKVDPFHPAPLPKGVHRIIFEDREAEGQWIPPLADRQ